MPESHLELTKQAVFAAGGGAIGNYQDCCWQSLGLGQFRPLPGSRPFIGNTGTLQQLPEWKVELVVADSLIRQTVDALLAAHPYETPAYDVWRLSDLPD